MATKKQTREAHAKEILKHLQEGYVVTQKLARKLWQCERTAARVWDLRHEGHIINTSMVYNESTGEKYAEYRLDGIDPTVYTEKSLPGKGIADYSRAIKKVSKPLIIKEELF